MAKNSWQGVPDGRPSSSTSEKASNGPRDGESLDYAGLPDNRPSSGTDDQRVKVGGGSFNSPPTGGPGSGR